MNPNVAVHAVGEFLTEENAAALLTDCDAVLDGLDNIQSRQILANACERAGIPLSTVPSTAGSPRPQSPAPAII